MNALAKQEERHEVAAPVAMTPAEMLNHAVSTGAGIEIIDKLMTLQERWEANQARKAFDQAMAAVRAELPVIGKNREVDFTTSKGRTNYRFEDLGEIARVVNPILAKHGMSYRYRTTQEGAMVSVTCIVSHRDGHAEENTLSAGKDDSGNKNSIQAVGSTISYLQRYTLKAALGIAASADDDGQKSEAPEIEFITDEQVQELQKLIEEAGTDTETFCRVGKIESVPDLPAIGFDKAKAWLQQRIIARKQKSAVDPKEQFDRMEAGQ